MTTKHPRLNVVLDKSLCATIKHLAGEDGVSLSLKARDLIREAIAEYEDSHWAEVASKREKALQPKKLVSHKKIWGK
ncbi:MAG: CopG family transcriptional regulator [bacterium]